MSSHEIQPTRPTIDELRIQATAAYEAHMASGILVDLHRDLLADAISQQNETRRIWLDLSKKLHDAEGAL